MVARSSFQIVTLLVLFQTGRSTSATSASPPAYHCQQNSPVINIYGLQCDLCDGNKQLLQEVNDLKKELAAIKDQISQIQPG